MHSHNWKTILGFALVALSAALYLIHYVIFHDFHHIFIYLVGDIAFVPIEVLLVTLIIHRLLSSREKRAVRNKLNMVIGAFFSEVGTDLLGILARLNRDADALRTHLIVENDWSAKRLSDARKRLRDIECKITLTTDDLGRLEEFLVGQRGFMLRLLENQSLLEHESFTDLLWATFHLTEELEKRGAFDNLPDTDIRRLEGDVKRVYRLIIVQWLLYLDHLKKSYPYLFSLSLRTNPFDPDASPVVTR